MNGARTVVVNFTRMGDLIQSGPLLRSLKKNSEERELVLVVLNAFAETARRLPMVDHVIAFDVDRLVCELDSQRGQWRRAYRDLLRFLGGSELENESEVYNLSHTRQSAMLCALLRPRAIHGMMRTPAGRIRVNGDWFAYLLSIMQKRSLNPFNLVEIYQRFAEVNERSNSLEFAVKREDREAAQALLIEKGITAPERYMVLQPGASTASRQWPPDRFAAVAVALNKRGIRSVLTGSAVETAMVETIARLSRGAAVSVAGRTNIGRLAALLESAEKVLSNDTGTIHLAAAVGTPTVGVFIGPASAKDTAPYGNGHIVLEPDLECAPCGYQDECRTVDCGKRIGVDHVLYALLGNPTSDFRSNPVWNGVRAYRTEVTDDGEFRLYPLNRPQTQGEGRLLEWYRGFWDSLLLRKTNSHEISPALDPFPECPDGIEALTRLFLKTGSQIALLRMAVEQRPKSAERMTQALTKQTIWQGELREFVERFPLLAPLPRYLQVRLSTIQGDDLHNYLSNLENLAEDFERGMHLLQSGNRNQMKRVIHAVA